MNLSDLLDLPATLSADLPDLLDLPDLTEIIDPMELKKSFFLTGNLLSLVLLSTDFLKTVALRASVESLWHCDRRPL